MSLVVILVFGIASIMVGQLVRGRYRNYAMILFGLSFGVRLAIHVFVSRSVSFFSHGQAGGDSGLYEYYANIIANIYSRHGIMFATADDFVELTDTHRIELVCNLFALITYVSGPSSLALTAVVALLAVATCGVIFRFALLVGANDRAAFKAMLVTLFGPSFLFHTSDCYKDGINAFLVVTSVYLSARLARKPSVAVVSFLLPMLWALYYVRPYMVAMVLAPVPVGLVMKSRAGRSDSTARFVIVGVVVLAMAFGMAFGAGDTLVGASQDQFQVATSSDSRNANAEGGSGVVFDDDGNPWNQIGSKILYTVLAPFPWMGGSFGLQIGKIDALLWYYTIAGAWVGARELWKRDRRTLALLLMFIAPGTVAYALSMSNVGLILRQRMPIMMVTGVLAAVGWSRVRQPGRTRSVPGVVRVPAPRAPRLASVATSETR